MLPFLVEQYGPDRAPRYLVSKLNTDAIDDTDYLLGPGEKLEDRYRLQAGSELVSWNGIPFARAVEVYADQETGGRPDSRRARALESLTLRALDYGPPPDEHWVIVGYRTGAGRGTRGAAALAGAASRARRPPPWTRSPVPSAP